MYKSDTKEKNRYGDIFWFEKVGDGVYKFHINNKLPMRWGGKDYEPTIDPNDLGMFDPSGGPYISLGTILDGKPITRIQHIDDQFILRTNI